MITIGRYSTHQPNFTAMVDPATFGAEAGFFWLKYGRFKGEKSEHGCDQVDLHHPTTASRVIVAKFFT
jgi:hypothetical protein